MSDTPPEGFEVAVYTHQGHIECPVYGGPVDISLYVPVDKTNWEGVTCACGRQLEAA